MSGEDNRAYVMEEKNWGLGGRKLEIWGSKDERMSGIAWACLGKQWGGGHSIGLGEEREGGHSMHQGERCGYTA